MASTNCILKHISLVRETAAEFTTTLEYRLTTPRSNTKAYPIFDLCDLIYSIFTNNRSDISCSLAQELVSNTRTYWDKIYGNVPRDIDGFIQLFTEQIQDHDSSKLSEAEKPYFDEFFHTLPTVTFGSEEYEQGLLDLKPALDHHYACNNHHPEYFKTGIHGMNLINITEMIIDWYAASKQHQDGDVYRSIETLQNKFCYPDSFKTILKNSILLIL